MKVGIVGHEAKKFTPETEAKARDIIQSILMGGPQSSHQANDILVSGGCHLGGIDIWAEEEADKIGLEKEIYLPVIKRWEGGFKQRNLQIVNASDIVHCIVVAEYPPEYVGMKFDYCYHCHTTDHIKSGGCWTARKAEKAQWHII